MVDVRDTARRIFIHLEEKSPPGRFWVFGSRVVPIVNYFQAALMLYQDETIEPLGVARIAAGLRDRYEYTAADLANSIEDLVRRRHLPASTLDRLLDSSVNGPGSGFLNNILRRGRQLAPLDPGDQPARKSDIDYLEILRSDRRLRTSVRDD
jgi:hypothetical protein